MAARCECPMFILGRLTEFSIMKECALCNGGRSALRIGRGF